jgi:hypothetical protein
MTPPVVPRQRDERIDASHGSRCLPQRVAERELSRHRGMRVLGLLASAHAVAGRHAGVRLSHLASAERRSGTAVAVGLMAAIESRDVADAGAFREWSGSGRAIRRRRLALAFQGTTTSPPIEFSGSP